MAFAGWRNEYATGVPEIDDQHRALFGAIEELHMAFMQNEDGLKIAQIVDFMNGYARTHFAAEEKLMAEHPDEGQQAHLQKHRDFELQVEDFLSRTESNTRMLSMEVLYYLRDWLIVHIQETDQVMTKRRNE